jgi:UDP-N-acetylglucosamine 1-carboxyvinyltransferase
MLKLEEAGAKTDIKLDEVTAIIPRTAYGDTGEDYALPGFPTDTQPQLMAALSLLRDERSYTRSVFDSGCSISTNLKRWVQR